MGDFISTERHEATALVTIDNPPMNALASANGTDATYAK